MELESYSNNNCNFIGSFRNISSSSVAVTGCLTNPGDKIHITLFSDINTASGIYELNYEGHVTALENPYKYAKGKCMFLNHKVNA